MIYDRLATVSFAGGTSLFGTTVNVTGYAQCCQFGDFLNPLGEVFLSSIRNQFVNVISLARCRNYAADISPPTLFWTLNYVTVH